MPNRPEYMAIWLGITRFGGKLLCLGSIDVPCNKHTSGSSWSVPEPGPENTEMNAVLMPTAGMAFPTSGRDDEARIEAKFDKARHRQLTGLAAGKALRDPEYEAAILRDAPDQSERKAARGHALPSLFGKHLAGGLANASSPARHNCNFVIQSLAHNLQSR